MITKDKKPTGQTEPVMVPLNKLHPFPDHPYKVLDNEEMDRLKESICEHGILCPILIRPIEDTDGEYEIISGHRRCFAARALGRETVPTIVCDLTRDEAAVLLVDSNLHREHLLPSEKAFAYKLKADAMSRQGQRTDLATSGQVVPKSDDSRTTAQIGKENGESYKTVQRYIRLTYLVPELLQFVDEGKIGMRPAV